MTSAAPRAPRTPAKAENIAGATEVEEFASCGGVIDVEACVSCGDWLEVGHRWLRCAQGHSLCAECSGAYMGTCVAEGSLPARCWYSATASSAAAPNLVANTARTCSGVAFWMASSLPKNAAISCRV